MRTAIALLTGFVSLSVTAPIEADDELFKRDISGPPSTQAGASNIVKDIQLAAQDLAKLSDVVSSNGGNDNVYTFYQLLSLLDADNAVYYDVNNGSASANASKTFSSAESCSISSANSALLPTASTTLKNFEAHYKAFNNTGVASTTLSLLQRQRETARQLLNAVKAKAVGTCTAGAPQQSSILLSYFDSAIRIYQQ